MQNRESVYQWVQKLYAKSESAGTKVTDGLEYIKEAMDIAESIDDYPGVFAFLEVCREKKKYLTKRRNAIARKRATLVFAIVVTGVFVTKVVLSEVDYRQAMAYKEGEYEKARAAFESLVSYKDSAEQIIECNNLIKEILMLRNQETVSAGKYHTVGLKTDGTVVATVFAIGLNDVGQCDVNSWKNIAIPESQK